MSDTRKCRLWFVRETRNARLYSKLPTARNQTQADMVWLPKSHIERNRFNGTHCHY